jgi:hypothetical protein
MESGPGLWPYTWISIICVPASTRKTLKSVLLPNSQHLHVFFELSV